MIYNSNQMPIALRTHKFIACSNKMKEVHTINNHYLSCTLLLGTGRIQAPCRNIGLQGDQRDMATGK